MNIILPKYKTWLPILIVTIAFGAAYYIFEAGKLSTKKNAFKKVKKLRIVKVVPLIQENITPSWFASGVAQSAESVSIVAQVSGEINQVNPVAKPGSLIEKDTWLVEIDPSDYLLNLKMQQAQLVQAQANYSLEEAEQILAKEELSLFENLEQNELQTALVLREPQLKAAKAKIAVAQANVEKAKLALSRTKVHMPFTGSIVNRNIGRGSRISQNNKMYDVVNIEYFWLEVKVPRKFLAHYDTSSTALIRQDKMWGDDVTRQAQFISILPALDSRDRQVKILLTIEDPLALKKENANTPAIFINDFLNVELKGRTINNAWLIKSNWLLADNTIWVVDRNNKLQKRAVDIQFNNREFVYIFADFEDGDMALTEKPGIAIAGVEVKPRKVAFNTLRQQTSMAIVSVNGPSNNNPESDINAKPQLPPQVKAQGKADVNIAEVEK